MVGKRPVNGAVNAPVYQGGHPVRFVDFTVDVANVALDLDLDIIIENPAPRWSINGTVNGPFTNHLPLT